MNVTNDLESQLDALGSNLGQSPPTKAPSAKTTRPPAAAAVVATTPAKTADTTGDSDDTLPPLVVRPAPGYFRFMPPLVQDLWMRGVEINMDSKSGDLLIEGFYRNGPMRLVGKGDDMVAVDRRNRETPISGFDDLAKLNYTWWKLSNSGGKGQYVVPNRPWIDFFLQKKWASRKVIYVPALDDGSDADNENEET